MTTDTFPALVKALSTAVAEASASPDPAVRAAWAERGVRAVEQRIFESWQERCLQLGFQYVRASDDHWVEASPEQMEDLLREVLGIDVRQGTVVERQLEADLIRAFNEDMAHTLFGREGKLHTKLPAPAQRALGIDPEEDTRV